MSQAAMIAAVEGTPPASKKPLADDDFEPVTVMGSKNAAPEFTSSWQAPGYWSLVKKPSAGGLINWMTGLVAHVSEPLPTKSRPVSTARLLSLLYPNACLRLASPAYTM